MRLPEQADGVEREGFPSLERDVERLRRRDPSGAHSWRSPSVLGTLGWSIALPATLGAWLGSSRSPASRCPCR